jgi:hypothetical protein
MDNVNSLRCDVIYLYQQKKQKIMKLEWERGTVWITLYFEKNEQATEFVNSFNKKGFDGALLDGNVVDVLIGLSREKEEKFTDRYITEFSK